MSHRTDSRFGHEDWERARTEDQLHRQADLLREVHEPVGPIRRRLWGGVGAAVALIAMLVAFAPQASAGEEISASAECPVDGVWTATFLVTNWKGGADGYTSFDDVTVLEGRHMRVSAVSHTEGELSGIVAGDLVVFGEDATLVTISGIAEATASVTLTIDGEWRWYTDRFDVVDEGLVEIDGKFYAGLSTSTKTFTGTAFQPEECEETPSPPIPDVVVPPVIPEEIVPSLPDEVVAPDEIDQVDGPSGSDSVDVESEVVVAPDLVEGPDGEAGVQASGDEDVAVAGIGVTAQDQVGPSSLPRTGASSIMVALAAMGLAGLGGAMQLVSARRR